MIAVSRYRDRLSALLLTSFLVWNVNNNAVDQYQRCAEGHAVLCRYHGVYRRGERSWEARLEEERQERAAAEATARLQADEVERAQAQAAAPHLADLGISALKAPTMATHSAAGAAECDAVQPVQAATATGSPAAAAAAAAAAAPHEIALRANLLDAPIACPPGSDAFSSGLPVVIAASQVPRPHLPSADLQPEAASAIRDAIASRTALDAPVGCHAAAIVIAPAAISRMEAERVAASAPDVTPPRSVMLTAPMVSHSEAKGIASDVASASLGNPILPEASADTSAVADPALPRPSLVPGTARSGPHPNAAEQLQPVTSQP